MGGAEERDRADAGRGIGNGITACSSGLRPSERVGMYVAELWRYPVKSLAGERLEAAELRPDGIVGDRNVVVYDQASGRVITSRTQPKLLGLRGTLGPDGQALIDGRPWDGPESAEAVRAAAGRQAGLA